jgi:hypothetical protein
MKKFIHAIPNKFEKVTIQFNSGNEFKNKNIKRRTIFSSNIGELNYQRASVLYNRGSDYFNKITIDTGVVLGFISIAVYIPVIFYSSELFSFFLGEHWKDSGMLSETIVYWSILIFITSHMLYVFFIKRILNKLIWYSWFSFIIKIVVFYFFATNSTVVNTVYYYVYTCITLEIVLLFFILINIKQERNKKIT